MQIVAYKNIKGESVRCLIKNTAIPFLRPVLHETEFYYKQQIIDLAVKKAKANLKNRSIKYYKMYIVFESKLNELI